MKKKYLIGIGILVLILVVAIIVLMIHLTNKKAREYQIEKIDQYHYFVLRQSDKVGVIDEHGNTIIAPEYDDVKIPNPGKPIFVCHQNENTVVKNEKNENIFTDYKQVEAIRLRNISSELMYEKSVLKYKSEDKFGLINLEGKALTKPIYEEMEGLPYKEGELLVKEDGKYGVINIKGTSLVDNEYETIEIDGYYTDSNQYKYAGYIVSTRTEEGYRYGYMDTNGKLMTKLEYNDIKRVTELEDNDNIYLIATKNGQEGILKNGQELIPNEYQSIRYDVTNNILVVEKSKKFGISNIDGKIIIPIEYNQIDITGMYLYAHNEQGITVYNSNGEQVSINEHIAILNTDNTKYKIRINNDNGTKYGVIGSDGKQLIEENYNYIGYLYENYFIVSGENSKLGILDDKGNEVIELKYDAMQKIDGTDLIQATISETKTTEIFNKNMQQVCEMENATIIVSDQFVKIYSEEETKYFDKDGKEMDAAKAFPNNKLYANKQEEKWGFADKNGKVVVDATYDKVTEFNQYGFAGIRLENKWGVVNQEGKVIVEPTYEINDIHEPSFIGNYYKVIYGYGEFYYTDK